MSETFYATGKRKTAVARVWLKAGTGTITVNKRSADTYFERETSRMIMRQPLELIEVLEEYDVVATVAGGGHAAQAEAMRHGIARALCVADGERRPPLKRAGFLTRDARKKERKKYGQPGARKRFQYSKR
ncbi:MAG: 30S ribosomal protein S9 [Polyangiaceae bacterium]|jgi:small subunit ribosomal protein S9|nr:30S ribosomal protein S9 [Polyangiaceae bacterium]MBK8942342.1 30S ribosomal protein S9 [Polyangiaceae bacterium]